MKTKTKLILLNQSFTGGRIWKQLLAGPRWLLVLALILFSLLSGTAQTLYWTNYAGTTPTWDLTSVNWTNTSKVGVAWSQAAVNPSSATNAVFGGADGTYSVTVGLTQIAASSITFSNSGYTLSGGTNYLPSGASSTIVVQTNKTATINNTVTGNSAQETFRVDPGATLNFGGNLNTIQVLLVGGGAVNLNSGIWTPNLFWGQNITFDQKGGTNSPNGTMFFGYAGNTFYTVESGAVLNENTGNFALCRGGNSGSVTLKSGSLVNVGITAVEPLMLDSYDASGSEHAALDVQGGTLNVGTNNKASTVQFMTTGSASGQSATFTIEGGTVNAWGPVQFGALLGSYNANSSNLLALSGGSLYLGASGLMEYSAHAPDYVVLSGGTLGALTNSSSTVATIWLGSTGGGVTIQAADAAGNAHNLSFSGVLTDALSGPGGFTKTGAGTLSLFGANTYSGPTVVQNGTLAISAANANTLTVTPAGLYLASGVSFTGTNFPSGVSFASAATTITVPNALALGVVAGMTVTGTGIPANTTVTVTPTSNTGANVQISAATTASSSGTYYFGYTTITVPNAMSMGIVAGMSISGTGIQSGTTVATTPTSDSGANVAITSTKVTSAPSAGAYTFGTPNQVTVSSASGLVVGQPITSGSGIATGATIIATNGTTLTLSADNTGSTSGYSWNFGAMAGSMSPLSTSLSIAAGATLDVSSISSFSLNSGMTLTASGTGTGVGTTAATIVGNAAGTVDFGSDNITLTYDGADPALYVSQGVLHTEGNLWTINGTPISHTGTYVIAHVASGNIVASGTANAAGSALTGAQAYIAFSGGDVQLVVTAVGTPVTVTGLTANNKIYDATTAATINANAATLSGVLPGDVGNVYLVTNGYTANFNNANVGVAKPVTVSGLSLGGGAAGNYYLVQPITNLTANITNASTTMTVSCPNTNVFAGWPYDLVASLASTGWEPTNELVTFTTNSVVVGTATLVAPSLASVLTSLAPGTYTITAGYAGDANVYGSTNSISVTVGTNSYSGWVWDADPVTPGAQDGSGTWSSGVLEWWNGNKDIAWDSTAAVFGAGVDAADGTYQVTLGNAITATGVSFNNSGYALSGSYTLTLGAGASVNVASNKIADINCAIYNQNSAEYWTVNGGAILNVGGNLTGMQPHFLGGGTTYLSGANAPSVTMMKGTIIQNGGSMTPVSSVFVSYQDAGTFGSYTVTNTTVTFNASSLGIARGGNTGQMFIQNGTTMVLGTGSSVQNLIVGYDNTGSDHALLDMQGGTLTLGSSSLLSQITVMASGGGTGETAYMTQEGGAITAWGGIVFGSSSLTYTSCTNGYTMSGGSLFLGNTGLQQGANHPTVSTITLSGGTVGALQGWSTTMPITLGTTNGNVDFECDDGNGNANNITLAGSVSGAGGLYKSGTGMLTLNGTINYSSLTVISNGTLQVQAALPTITGPVTLDGSLGGSPMASVLVSTPGQNWSMGNLTYAAGTTTADFEFGSLTPSKTVAPIQVAGNLNFTVTPNVTIGGTAIPTNTYPLIQYTGTLSGNPPTTVTLPVALSASGYITNLVASKTIALVVTKSGYNPALYWRVGNGAWDINATANWNQNGSAVKYLDGDPVVFDDGASGPSPILVTLNTTVSPFSVSAANTTNSYTIAGNGSIAGTAGVTMVGAGSLTLGGVNTYSGGTTVSSGQLNINNGGNGSGTAIGTGTLTLSPGVTLDNTSGSNVTLQTSIPEVWGGNFTYLGSSNSLNMGPGGATMSQDLTVLVSNNTFTVGGAVTDNNEDYALTKTGNGTLTLGTANTITKGFTLLSGRLNLGDGGSVGTGYFYIDGGSIDNVSGSDEVLGITVGQWNGNFTYVGSTNNLDFGGAPISVANLTVVTVLSNTLTTEGAVTSGNGAVIKAGPGTWNIIGNVGGNGAMIVNGGQVNFGKTLGQCISSGGTPTPGVTINSNALVMITGTDGNQITDGNANLPNPVKLNSGIFDLNGQSETVDSVTFTNGGVLRNGQAGTYSTLKVGPVGSYTITLATTNADFDVPDSAAELDIAAIVAGSGSLLKTGAGTVNIYSNSVYAGSTIVNAGTLTINYASLATNSLVSIAGGTNALLNLTFAGTNQVGSLVINGSTYQPGVYSATTDPLYLSGTGSLLVLSSIATNPTNIFFNVVGGNLSLSWPADHAGWILQSQTNSLSGGLGTNWVDVAGSSSTTFWNIPINTQSPTVFFRLRSP